MSKTFAYIETGETYLTLGSKGIAVYITSQQKTGGGSERVVGTLFVGKAGIRWLPKKKWSVVKGRRVLGAPVSWSKLDEIAKGKTTLR